MPNLADLPTEIVRMICSALYVEAANDDHSQTSSFHSSVAARNALAKFCRTCSQFRSIAQPLLYRKLGKHHSSDTVMLFLRTVVDQPRLAAHVQSVYLADGPFDFTPDMAPFEGPIRALKVDFVKQWIQALRHSETDDDEDLDFDVMNAHQYEAVIVTCLAFLPNLRSIDFTRSPEDSQFLGGLAAALNQVPGCSKLQTMTVRHWDTGGGFRFDGDVALLTFPALRHITLVATIDDGPLRLAPESVSASHWTLEETGMGLVALKLLMQACTAVETMEFYTCSPNVRQYAGGARGEPATPRDLIHALNSQKSALKSLTIILDQYHEIWTEHLPEDEPLQIPDLKSFAALEHLEVEQKILMAEDDILDVEEDDDAKTYALSKLLPPSIRSLVIWEVDDELVAPMRKFADVCVEEFPRLETVQLNLQGSSSGWILRFEELASRFESVGVTYKVSQTRLVKRW